MKQQTIGDLQKLFRKEVEKNIEYTIKNGLYGDYRDMYNLGILLCTYRPNDNILTKPFGKSLSDFINNK